MVRGFCYLPFFLDLNWWRLVEGAEALLYNHRTWMLEGPAGDYEVRPERGQGQKKFTCSHVAPLQLAAFEYPDRRAGYAVERQCRHMLRDGGLKPQ